MATTSYFFTVANERDDIEIIERIKKIENSNDSLFLMVMKAPILKGSEDKVFRS